MGGVFLLPILLIIGLLATVAALWLRKQPIKQTAPPRRLAVAHPARRKQHPALARQRRRYQARIRTLERQQLTLIYLLWLQSQQSRPARPAAATMEAVRA